MSDFQTIYKAYINGQKTDIETLESLLLISNEDAFLFWDLLKSRKAWDFSKEVSTLLDKRIEKLSRN